MQEANTTKENWDSYCTLELGILEPILKELGYTLEEDQKHLKGERFLMQAITTESGKKLILTGKSDTQVPVIIKATRDDAGKKEIEHERSCRSILHRINFAAEVFHSPKELVYTESHGFLISIQEYITQEKSFLDRPTEEQFQFALRSFKAQEGAHATTYKHQKTIGKAFEIRTPETYLNNFQNFVETVSRSLPDNSTLQKLLTDTKKELQEHAQTIEQYCGFLTHTDFVPHNIRIKDKTVYLLDHSSLAFGNKYEGWARFINFMVLYNQPLQKAFEQYVQDNRSEGEQETLRLMRLYRLGEIICYYTGTLERSEDSLLELNKARIEFWQKVLEHKLANTPLPEEIVESYKTKRDSLRSEDEIARQKGLH